MPGGVLRINKSSLYLPSQLPVRPQEMPRPRKLNRDRVCSRDEMVSGMHVLSAYFSPRYCKDKIKLAELKTINGGTRRTNNQRSSITPTYTKRIEVAVLLHHIRTEDG